MKVVIVGGVAGGASCAARLRRLAEGAQITILERGPFVSFANCGLPYYVGNVITERAALEVAKPSLFHNRFNIDVRTKTEALAIDRAAKTVTTSDGVLDYDYLVLAPGAAPVRPKQIPGVDRPGVLSLRTIPDADRIKSWIESHDAKTATVVGAGFIGIEMAEMLRLRGLAVTLLDASPQILPPLDPEMSRPLQDAAAAAGVTIRLGEALERIDDDLTVHTAGGGEPIPSDLVILCIGVRPESKLASDAGLELGPHGGIMVNERLQTSDPHILAVGDAVEDVDYVMHGRLLMPLAGPANAQGRLAAAVIAGDPDVRYRGVQGTAVCGAFGTTVALTGESEKALARAGTPYQVVRASPGHHVGYYPGATKIHLKVIFDPRDGRLLGAQATGEHGAERRIDVFSALLQMRGTIDNLCELELCYSPAHGSAKDPLNILGFIAQNHQRGIAPVVQWSAVGDTVVDVREPAEYDAMRFAGTRINLPLSTLRTRLADLEAAGIPKGARIDVTCATGQRAHTAVCFLRANGYDARNITGGVVAGRMLGVL